MVIVDISTEANFKLLKYQHKLILKIIQYAKLLKRLSYIFLA